ncbi:MAG: hypothetical protein Q8K75_12455 [Chlamydiales bacterium]|nr:hypothetical protein [Chlamydiales bacterium]
MESSSNINNNNFPGPVNSNIPKNSNRQNPAGSNIRPMYPPIMNNNDMSQRTSTPLNMSGLARQSMKRAFVGDNPVDPKRVKLDNVISSKGNIIGESKDGNGLRIVIDSNDQGTYYNDDGTIFYQGGFVNNKPQGVGILYKSIDSSKKCWFENGIPMRDYCEYSGGKMVIDYRPDCEYAFALPRGFVYEGKYKGDDAKSTGSIYLKKDLYYRGQFTNYWPDGDGVFYKEGKPEYEGQVVNSSRTGYGKLFDSNGQVTFEGQFLNGAIFGQGTEFKNGVTIYKGEFLGGVRTGQGELYNEQGVLRYKGGFLNGEGCGAGTLYSKGFTFSGYFICKVMTGPGTISKDGHLFYQGDLVNYKKHGNGKSFNQDGSWYEGQFVEDKRNGQGRECGPDGSVTCDGFWSDDKLVSGKKHYADGRMYQGDFQNNVEQGTGKLYDFKGTLKYEGKFTNGYPNGLGTVYFENGVTYEGHVLKLTLDGQGTLYRNGVKTFVGNFLRNKKHGYGIDLRDGKATLGYYETGELKKVLLSGDL